MDRTKKYIKMCRSFREIQNYKKLTAWKSGDWCYDSYPAEYMINEKKVWLVWNGVKCDTGYHNWHEYWEPPTSDAVWLPTVGQLEQFFMEKDKILRQLKDAKNPEAFLIKSHYIHTLMTSFIEKQKPSVETPEQLRLAFVAYGLYNKVWDDEKECWVKVSTEEKEKSNG